MGQFVAAFSHNNGAVQGYVDRGVMLAAELFEYNASEIVNFGFAGIAAFGRPAYETVSGHVFSFPEERAWCVSAGTWVHADDIDARTALQRCGRSLSTTRRLESELEYIDGSYCFVLGRNDIPFVQVVTDPIGQFHVYQTRIDDTVIVSTSALLLAQLANCDWDSIAVREFLAKGSVYEQRSLFNGVVKLAPGSILTFDDRLQPQCRRYWSLQDHINRDATDSASLEAFAGAVKAGVSSVYNAHQTPALDLTGGFDSRIILAFARGVTSATNINTVVVGEQGSPDVRVAGQIAELLGLTHQQSSAQPTTTGEWWTLAQNALPLVDGEYDILEYARILNVHQQLAEQFDVSINGSGGELIRGYWWELLFPRTGAHNNFDARRVAQRRYAVDTWAEKLLAAEFSDTLVEHFTGVVERYTGNLRCKRNTACLDNIYLMMRMQRWQGRITSATNRIWPCLSPLLFRQSIEAAVSASVALRRNGGMARQLLANIDPELARLPMTDGYSAMPMSLPVFLSRHGAQVGSRVVRRLAPHVGRRSLAANRRWSTLTDLVSRGEVRNMLDPHQMLTANLYSDSALHALCSSITSGQFSEPHVGRLLTLECLARRRVALRRSNQGLETMEA